MGNITTPGSCSTIGATCYRHLRASYLHSKPVPIDSSARINAPAVPDTAALTGLNGCVSFIRMDYLREMLPEYKHSRSSRGPERMVTPDLAKLVDARRSNLVH